MFAKTIILWTALTIAGQTAIPPAQMRGSIGSAWRIIAIAPDGSFRQLYLGPGISVTNGVISVTVPVPVPMTLTPMRARLVLISGAYVMPVWTSTITRNGLLMEEGEDYTVAAGVLTPKGAWEASDFVVARGFTSGNPGG